MKLISSGDTVEFLSQAAPKPWVKKMLLWLIFEGQLNAYFSTGKIQSSVPIYKFLLEAMAADAFFANSKTDQYIRENYEPEIADKIIGKKGMIRLTM